MASWIRLNQRPSSEGIETWIKVSCFGPYRGGLNQRPSSEGIETFGNRRIEVGENCRLNQRPSSEGIETSVMQSPLPVKATTSQSAP